MYLLWSSFVEAPCQPGDLNFNILMFHSGTRGGFAIAIPSKHPVRLGPHGGTSHLGEAALSESVLDTFSVPPSCALSPWRAQALPSLCSTVKVGVIMVGDLSIDAFICDELLTGHLAGCAVLGSVAPLSHEIIGISSLSMRMSYWFSDSNTVQRALTEVVKATPIVGGGVMFECTYK